MIIQELFFFYIKYRILEIMLNFNIFRALLRTTYTIFFSFIIEQFFNDSVFVFFPENLIILVMRNSW